MAGVGDRLLLACLPWLAARLVRWLSGTLRAEIIGDESARALWAENGQSSWCTGMIS